MKHKAIKIFFICLAAGVSVPSFAQQEDPSFGEKEFREAIDKKIESLADNLKLEDWQVFYVDSILTHDLTALKDEIDGMSKAKISNTDLYVIAQDKWEEKIYRSLEKVLDKDQWAKYNKQGAARDKKARDKREAKRHR